MERRDVERSIKRAKIERKRRALEKRRRMERRVITFFAIIIAVVPFLFTVVTGINSISLLVFDILWFNLILISCIWTN